MLAAIFIIGSVAFILAYVLYGRFMAKRYELDDSRLTPSHIHYDGIDRVPAQKSILLGHHFSSIAGAGPIVAKDMKHFPLFVNPVSGSGLMTDF